MTMTSLLVNLLAYDYDDINENDMWIVLDSGYACCPTTKLMCLVTVEDILKERHVVISQYDPAIGWSNLNAGEKVIAWMPMPEACKGVNKRARIEREDGRVYYIDDDGNRYILYLLADLQDPCRRCDRWLLHDMVIAVEDEDGGRPCGFFYQEGLDDESLLDCCKQYVTKGGHLF